jgi:hypothetical protein
MTSHRTWVLRAAALACSIAFVGSATSAAFAHGHHHQANHSQSHKGALYVSPSGKTGAADRNCRSAGYSTVQSAVNAAPSGGTVVVCRGSYTEDVVISGPLTLTGNHGSTIHGSPTTTATCQQLGAGGFSMAPCLAAITIKSSHVKVQGLKVTGATGEGILATGSLTGGSISYVTIQSNRVVGNDQGGIPPSTTSLYPQCLEVDQIPGDCGEGIHLMGVTNSSVNHNYVSGNSGGVLLTDEFGPTAHNVVSHNTVTKNLYDCGITAPGHNPFALDTNGTPQPTKAGVFDNMISHNKITGNGTSGEGAGVLFANATAGSGSYDNTVEFNTISGNELAGVTMHAHTLAPGQFEDLNGNRIVHNNIGTNNTGGDPLDGTTSDDATTGVLVFSGTVPVTVTISHNRIHDDHYGIWLGVGGNITASMSHNVFTRVGTSVFTAP